MNDWAVLSNKYDDFEKPFTQTEAGYVMTTVDINRRCETCRFYQHRSRFDPCLLLANDSPLPIVGYGYCEKYVELPQVEASILAITDMGAVLALELLLGEDSLKQSKISSELLLPAARGFKMFGPSELFWIAWYSNNFEDKEGELFSTESLDYYNLMTLNKFWEQPELWCFHKSFTKHGKSLRTMRLGHFQLSVGKFDDPAENQIVDNFRNFYQDNPVTMSHGYYYSPKHFVNGVYNRHQTFEISTLAPGREANPFYTSLNLGETI